MHPIFRGFPKAVGIDLNRLFLDGIWEFDFEDCCPENKLVLLGAPRPKLPTHWVC